MTSISCMYASNSPFWLSSCSLHSRNCRRRLSLSSSTARFSCSRVSISCFAPFAAACAACTDFCSSCASSCCFSDATSTFARSAFETASVISGATSDTDCNTSMKTFRSSTRSVSVPLSVSRVEHFASNALSFASHCAFSPVSFSAFNRAASVDSCSVANLSLAALCLALLACNTPISFCSVVTMSFSSDTVSAFPIFSRICCSCACASSRAFAADIFWISRSRARASVMWNRRSIFSTSAIFILNSVSRHAAISMSRRITVAISRWRANSWLSIFSRLNTSWYSFD
mmetsp:Transcript_1785/g.3114  ORF Transcript_1785/g.3114 Transcript_1785/m.3114 type:complete len:287 (-) Transcript_1785:1431-2291(-)